MRARKSPARRSPASSFHNGSFDAHQNNVSFSALTRASGRSRAASSYPDMLDLQGSNETSPKSPFCMKGAMSISIPEAGGYDKLEIKPISTPTTGPNIELDKIDKENLVVVHNYAIGVNYADICVRWGLYDSAKKYVGWPICPGFEYSGKVKEVGKNVTKFKPGDRVFGCTMFGAYSTHVSVPESQLFHLPYDLPPEAAAGLPCVHLTAWYAAFEMANVKEGQTVMVHSAAGGVGSALVQMCKIAGCKVVGVVGKSHKVKYCEDLGCDVVIDKSSQDLWKEAKNISPNGYEAIFDANGVSTLQKSFDSLAPAGRLVVYGFHSMLPKKGGYLGCWEWIQLGWSWWTTPRFNPLEMTSTNRSVMAFNLSFLFDRQDILQKAMEQIMEWLANGDLQIPRVVAYTMDQVAEAHKSLESGETMGKLILTTH